MCAPDRSWSKKETVHGQKSFHFSVFQNTLKPVSSISFFYILKQIFTNN